ncbi:hypothetical protein MLD38_018368 [Melastoma candidum]|uniref:Uncharacterized protein n=1 Tax=Melastoma candidum TaxID=119954 RepID=A0ACB9QU51_9MYRT|nr:hypothetical protein MLD38_018368 [Melastoma candidum]
MTLSECIASVGRRTFLDNARELGMHQNSQSYNDQVEHSLEPSLSHHCTDLLDALRYVVQSCKQHFNPNYRLKVCQKILEVAVSVVCPDSVPLEMLLHFVSAFPSEFTDYGGVLRIKLQQWLSGGRSKCSCRSCKGGGRELLKSLCGFPAEFVGSLHVGRSTFVCDDEELAAWEGEAKRWVTTLFLVMNDKDSFDPLCVFIYDHGTRICEEKQICQWLPVKYLILLFSLVCQLQQLLENDSDVCADPGRKLMFSRLLDTLNGTYQKFLLLFNSIMKNLVLFTKVSCTVLWFTLELEATKLPSSVCGKLGGPSQRRLPSEITSSVLQAITSVKVITSLSSWCKMIGSDVSVDFTFDFFWDFLWNTLSSSACNSETEAEIGLAAYEALAPVLRTLALRYPSLSLDQIVKQHNPVAADMENEPLLDALMKKFLQNINCLLEVGYLARSRKAALMKFKWCCLESLLSIPILALKSGYKPAKYKFYFSDDVVRETFAELVENLENAAEDAVLPMLRSIRLVLALLTSRSDILVSCGGVNIQMIWQLVQSSWILHVSCNKRRVAAISALLSSVLHPSYFSDEKMHMINGDSGPLKWFVEKVLEEGTRSPRTIRLAALHLTGLWLAYPRVLKYYIKELKLLSLHGSVAFDEDFEGELGDNHDAKAEVSLLAMSPEPELTKAFLNTELYARVSVAALFQKLADLAEDDDLVDIHDDKTAALEAGRLFLLELLHSAVNEKDLAKELYKKYSAVHRRKIRAWQMICGLSRFVHEDILDQVTNSLHTSLYRNNLPAVRQYLETFAINVYLKFPSLVKEQLVPILLDHNTKPQALSSYVFIAANIILHAPNQLKSKHLEDLLPPVIPLLTSHHHSLRGFTQLLVYKVLHKSFPPSSVEASQHISLEERCFSNLREYLSKNSDCMRLRASMEGYLDNYDPVISATPAGIFVNRVEDLEFECVPTSLMEQILNFLNVVREDLRCSMANDLATIKSESLRLGEDQSNTNLNCDDKNDVSLLEPSMNASANFQRKFTLARHGKEESDLHASLGFSNLYQQTFGEMEKDDQLLDQSLQSRIMTIGKIRASRQQIILVASLLDRIPNLAGLARTCEVFKASGLAIADTTVLQDKQFQLISVTAERWVPIIEVPVKSLVGFLQKKRREGFSILGLEQTANSVLLDKFAFPKKTVLVLGREKEGIPPEIIHILDACVEIPQLGIVRSLNVHVSGAVALWEYTRQQRCQ